jgi:hypothetical protein
MSALGGKPENICSLRAFPVWTLNRHGAVRNPAAQRSTARRTCARCTQTIGKPVVHHRTMVPTLGDVPQAAVEDRERRGRNPTIRVYLQILTAIGAESCGVEQRQALPHKPCWAQTREPRRLAVPGPFCLPALTRSRSTHSYRGIAHQTKADCQWPTSGTGHLQSLSRQST